MPPSDPCPPLPELEALLLGRLPPPRAAALQRHLGDCSACPARAEGLKLESRLMSLLAEKPPAETELPPALRRLMATLERLVPDPQSATETLTDIEREEDFSFLRPAEGPDELGRLADYRVLRLLGRGGMGLVFRAEDLRLARPVGLKVLRPRAACNPSARERFLREARAMASVKHDHIAVIHEVGVAAGSGAEVPFLAMELLDGESLYGWMRRNRRPPAAWVARIGRQAASGLAAAHAAGLIHRDIKPSNLWLEAPPGRDGESLGAAGRVKLIDFGMAAPLGPGADPDALAGTPAYMAPEQFAAAPLDGRCDLFALGCVLYELSTGEHPFPGRSLGDRPFEGDPPPAPARDLNPELPAALSRLIGRMLADDPADRPPTARAAEAELAAIAAERRSRRPLARHGGVALVGVALIVAVATLLPATPTAAPTVAVERPPFPAGPPDEWWCQRAAELPTREQFPTVVAKVAELNPGYDAARALGWVEREGVIRFTILSDSVTDIRPVRGLPDVRTVRVAGTAPVRGRFTDLTPLAGLRLHTLILDNNPALRDLAPVHGTRLTKLELTNTAVESLDGIEGALLEELLVAGTRIRDLAPIRRMPRLRVLDIAGCPVASLEPLAGTPIRQLRADIDLQRDAATLGSMRQLAQLNGRPANEFRRAAPATRR